MSTPERIYQPDQTVSIDLRSRANTVALYAGTALFGELALAVPGSFLMRYVSEYTQAISTGYSVAVGATLLTAAAAALKNTFEVPEKPINLGELTFPTLEKE